MKTKIIFWTLLFVITLGFRAVTHRWAINPDDPYLWIRVCGTELTKNISNDFPNGDVLSGRTLTRVDVINDVIDQINELETSYLRLELYETGAHFDVTKAEGRTIDFCPGGVGAMAARGVAKLDLSGSRIKGCSIKIKANVEESGVSWAGVFAH